GIIGKIAGDVGSIDIGESVGGGGDDQAGIQGRKPGGIVGQGLGGKEREIGGIEQLGVEVGLKEKGIGGGCFCVQVVGAVEVAQPAHVIAGQRRVEHAIVKNVGQGDVGRGDGGLVSA